MVVVADMSTRVLDAVLELFEGDQRLTYDAVARRAGVSRQTVYTHFPSKADLLVAAVQRARELADVESGIRAIYAAPTAVAALDALVELHGSFVPRFLRAHVAVERERANDPDVEFAFTNRRAGRRQVAAHIATRLRAEGYLTEPWTVQTAGELIESVTSGTFTAQLLRDAGWSGDEVGARLRLLLRRTLLDPTHLDNNHHEREQAP
jgi:AcrR family transcriptional regulator